MYYFFSAKKFVISFHNSQQHFKDQYLSRCYDNKSLSCLSAVCNDAAPGVVAGLAPEQQLYIHTVNAFNFYMFCSWHSILFEYIKVL